MLLWLGGLIGTALLAYPAQAHYHLESLWVDATTWPTVTFVLAPVEAASEARLPSGEARLLVQEDESPKRFEPTSLELFRQTDQPLTLVLVINSSGAMTPYIPALTGALERFAQRLAQVLPGARLQVIPYGGTASRWSTLSTRQAATRFRALTPDPTPGRRFSEALCTARDLLSRTSSGDRRLLLILSDGLDVDPDGHEYGSAAAARCESTLTRLAVPTRVLGFAPLGDWKEDPQRAAEQRLRALALPYGRYIRVDTPVDSVSEPAFGRVLVGWADAIANSLVLRHRVRAAPQGRITLRLWQHDRALPLVVTLNTTLEPAPRDPTGERRLVGFVLLWSLMAGGLAAQTIRVLGVLRRHGAPVESPVSTGVEVARAPPDIDRVDDRVVRPQREEHSA